MRIRYVPADPAGNLTGMVLSRVPRHARAALAAQMMARCSEGFEQMAFIDEESLSGPLPRLEMMGGEFCGNATRAFGYYVAQRRGLGEKELLVSVSGAQAPVRVRIEADCAYADMPLPREEIRVGAEGIPVVRMEGIDHAILTGEQPSGERVRAVLACMPQAPAQGVMFLQGNRLTPFVFVAATGTGVWESSCGSGSVATAWHLSQGQPDGVQNSVFEEPGGVLEVRVIRKRGRTVCVQMGGRVAVGEERVFVMDQAV